MKLKNIDNTVLQKAIDIYLNVAYDGMPVPPNVRLNSVFDEVDDDVSWMGDQRFEVEQGLGSNRFFLRLGNKQYPHMKLAVVECAGMIGEFVFMADTHDRHFDLIDHLPDLEEFKALQVENDRIKEKIEAAWRENGIPTEVSFNLTKDSEGKTTNADYTILVVDDTDSMRLLEEKAFAKSGFRVLTSSSGADAIEMVTHHKIDLCVLDVMMPMVNGYDVIETLEERGLRDFPIVLCTAAYEGKVRKDLADDYIAKPFSPNYLVNRCKALLEIA